MKHYTDQVYRSLGHARAAMKRMPGTGPIMGCYLDENGTQRGIVRVAGEIVWSTSHILNSETILQSFFSKLEV